MKLKFKLITIFATLGVVATGLAAWNFTKPVEGEVNIDVDIETHQSIGIIEFDTIGEYNLDDNPHPLEFTARYLEGSSGVSVDKLLLTYEVVLNEELSELISFGALSTGLWTSDVTTSITPTWNSGKNPTNMVEYNAIKDNLASYRMKVILNAEVINENTPRATTLALVFGDGVTNGMELEVGDSIDISVVVYDQYGNQIGYLHPNANLVSGGSATYVDGVLTAISPESDGTIIFSLPGLDDLVFNFTIKSLLKEFSATFTYGNGEENTSVPVIENDRLVEPSVPFREGFSFNGWFNGTELYDFNTPVTGNIELHATWLDGDLFVYTLLADNTYKMVGYTQRGNAEITRIYVPSTYQDIDITVIGSGVFNSVPYITSIRLPDTITRLDQGSFSVMPHLVSINMPTSLVSIGENALAACVNLTSIVMANNVTSIENYVFSRCTALSEVVLSESLVSIGNEAFDQCTSLTSIDLPESLVSIGNKAFNMCSGLTSFIIPKSVTTVGAYVLQYCTGLQSIEIPANIILLNAYFFQYCSNLVEVILNEGLETIHPYAFGYCTSLRQLTMPSTVTTVSEYAFIGCVDLQVTYL